MKNSHLTLKGRASDPVGEKMKLGQDVKVGLGLILESSRCVLAHAARSNYIIATDQMLSV